MKGKKKNKKCEICESNFGILNAKFQLDDGHVICTKCQNVLGFWYKPDEKKYKAIPFERVLKSYKEKKDMSHEETTDKSINKPGNNINILICPNCNSKNINFVQNDKKSFSVGKAVGGAALTGGIGTLAGFTGKKGNDIWHCLDCGNLFETKHKK